MKKFIMLALLSALSFGFSQSPVERHADEMAGNLGAIKIACPATVTSSLCYREGSDVSSFIRRWDLYFDWKVTEVPTPTTPWREATTGVLTQFRSSVVTTRTFVLNGVQFHVYHLSNEDFYIVTSSTAGTTSTTPSPTVPSKTPPPTVSSNSPAGIITPVRVLPDGTNTLGVIEESTSRGTFYCYETVYTTNSLSRGFDITNWKDSGMGTRVSVTWGTNFLSLGADGEPLSSSTVELVFSDTLRTMPRINFRYSKSGYQALSLDNTRFADGTTLVDKILQHQGTIEVIITDRVVSPSGILTQETKTMSYEVTQQMIQALREGFGVHCLNRY
jgi:hypothetical protein